MRLNATTLFQNHYRNKPSILFCHVPKTGGSSIASAIRRHFLFSNFNIRSEASSLASLAQYGLTVNDPENVNACQTLRSALAFYAAAQKIKFITGHLWRPLQMPVLKTMGYRTVSFLRDPVDRWYSLYFYGRYKEGSYKRIDSDFEDFLGSEDGINAGRVYVQYFGGIRTEQEYASTAAIGQAKAGMQEFDLIGFLDDIPGFTQQFQEKFGLQLKIPHKRQSPANKVDDLKALMRKYKESADIRAQVTALCAPDIEIYQYARQTLGR